MGLESIRRLSDGSLPDPGPKSRAPAAATRDRWAVGALASVQVLFGTHYLAGKLVVAEIPPGAWSLLRAGGAAALLVGICAACRMPLPRGAGTLARFAGLALLGVALNQWLFLEGLRRTSPGHSALVNTVIPVLVLLIAVLTGRERARPRRIAGILVTLAGVLLLLVPSGSGAGSSRTGDLLTFCNATSYALFLVAGKPVLEREKTLPATALLMLFGAMWLVPLGAWELSSLNAGGVTAQAWWLGAYVIVGPTVGAYLLNTYALRRLESSVVALFIYLQPLIGAGASIAVGMDHLTPRFMAAGAIIFLGVFLCLVRPRARSPLQAGRTADE